jgi:dihydroflavonol-4-reductase
LPSDAVFVTGATGFVGRHVARALRETGYAVHALVRDAAARVDADRLVVGSLERAGDLVPALAACRYLIHCAALYSFSPRDARRIERVNVAGTASLLAAARIAGIERAVVTSSSATLGPARDGRPCTEDDVAVPDGQSPYHRSKLLQERVALAARVPVVLVLPTAPVGPEDAKPTPTGRLIVDYARGRIFARPAGFGGLNVVAVEDVARAHVLAVERGRPRERYIVGGENLSFSALWDLLAEVTGRPAPRWVIPYWTALGIAHLDDLRCRAFPGATPFAPLEGVRMSQHAMYVNDDKARTELGHSPSPVRAALERAVTWYRQAGYLTRSAAA